MDRISPEARSKLMSRIKDRDTRPEMIVRRLVWAMGRRYRLHNSSLPGKPDLVLASTKQIIFINGCFWHRHDCRKGQSVPLTRTEFWITKFEKNKRHDEKVRKMLRIDGWSVLDVWECELSNQILLKAKLQGFLGKR